MAQADILVELVRTATSGDQIAFRKAAESLIQEEKAKGHRILAERLAKSLQPLTNPVVRRSLPAPGLNVKERIHKKIPAKLLVTVTV